MRLLYIFLSIVVLASCGTKRIAEESALSVNSVESIKQNRLSELERISSIKATIRTTDKGKTVTRFYSAPDPEGNQHLVYEEEYSADYTQEAVTEAIDTESIADSVSSEQNRTDEVQQETSVEQTKSNTSRNIKVISVCVVIILLIVLILRFKNKFLSFF
ncbi:MAG: hypothetical protein JW783_08195 [Bacteroidales bacterium]|nr:hypothetical protein [Bacteroidales bacterium]MBN2749921.1 hypothetical protein [Bacteroidales bacterium]